jgi:hypothetical protein
MPDIPPVLVVRMKSRAASDKNPKASQEPADALVIE